MVKFKPKSYSLGKWDIVFLEKEDIFSKIFCRFEYYQNYESKKTMHFKILALKLQYKKLKIDSSHLKRIWVQACIIIFCRDLSLFFIKIIAQNNTDLTSGFLKSTCQIGTVL
ncbi:hypothetical protein BpHYR1_029611 [Brachionus plicatilis]|uniref:Uncharacterized protein n=1 Tax=Brachionus plicatilis TaxID=10195 RepID=A0A3M7R0Y7_BRAPC|nr:hypothetical protein BpHYR1_029611 [Brachionus plicatilis]